MVIKKNDTLFRFIYLCLKWSARFQKLIFLHNLTNCISTQTFSNHSLLDPQHNTCTKSLYLFNKSLQNLNHTQGSIYAENRKPRPDLVFCSKKHNMFRALPLLIPFSNSPSYSSCSSPLTICSNSALNTKRFLLQILKDRIANQIELNLLPKFFAEKSQLPLTNLIYYIGGIRVLLFKFNSYFN